jgi:hypothetical protein
MNKLNVVKTGLALAVTLALFNSLCATIVALWPALAIAFANAWMHELDLQLIRADAPLTLGRFVYGLVGVSVTGFVIGGLYAWVYNWMPKIRRNAG